MSFRINMMGRAGWCFSLLNIATLALSITHASAGEPRFGPEFEFSTFDQFREVAIDTVKKGLELGGTRAANWIQFAGAKKANYKVMRQLFERYRALSSERGFRVEPRGGDSSVQNLWAFHLRYPDGFWVEFVIDTCVIEVKTMPQTLAEFSSRADQLQRDVFEVVASVGAKPGKGLGLGNGHVNIDVETGFGGDLLLLRNFLVDYTNHAELAHGIHLSGLDRYNAPPLAEDREHYEYFRDRFVAAFDRGELTRISSIPSGYPGGKFSALNLHFSEPHKERIEIRAIRHQSSIYEFIALARLFQERIAMLKKLGTPVPLLTRGEILSSLGRLRRYREYVEESGLPWNEYRALMPWHLQCASLFL